MRKTRIFLQELSVIGIILVFSLVKICVLCAISLPPVRMTIFKKTTNKCWQEYG